MPHRAPVQEAKRHRWIGVLLLLLVVLGVFAYSTWVNASNDDDGGRVEFMDH
jgi:hypothetical protein